MLEAMLHPHKVDLVGSYSVGGFCVFGRCTLLCARADDPDEDDCVLCVPHEAMDTWGRPPPELFRHFLPWFLRESTCSDACGVCGTPFQVCGADDAPNTKNEGRREGCARAGGRGPSEEAAAPERGLGHSLPSHLG